MTAVKPVVVGTVAVVAPMVVTVVVVGGGGGSCGTNSSRGDGTNGGGDDFNGTNGGSGNGWNSTSGGGGGGGSNGTGNGWIGDTSLVVLLVDGVWEEWSLWGECPVTCGGSVRLRNRTCIEAQYGGQDCEGPSQESEVCGTAPCPSKLHV